MKYKYSNCDIKGIEKYPQHWKLDRLRDNIYINVATLSAKTSPEQIIRYIDITNVNISGIVNLKNIESIKFEDAPSRARRIVKENDTIISSVRTNLQAVAHIDFNSDDLIASTGFFVCRPKFTNFLNPKYLYWILLSNYSKDYFFSHSVGVSYPAINDYRFGSIKFPFPPIKEQNEIVKYLDNVCEKIDDIIKIKFGTLKISNVKKSASNQVQVLQNYKKSLIHECITGKKQIYKGNEGE